MWRRVKACSVKSFSFPLTGCSELQPECRHCSDKKLFVAKLDSTLAVQHLFFADLYRGCLRAIVTGGGQRTTCKRRHRRSGLADRRLWQRECAQRSAALCFVLSTVICQRWFIYRVLKVTLEVFSFYFAAVNSYSLYFWGSMTSQVDAKGKRHIFQRTFHKLCLYGAVLRREDDDAL